jgi:CRISPR/Cas system-associated exonuclease Cas4 (RecB family)
LPSLYETSFREFSKHTVPVHILAEYWYCAAQITNRKIQGDIETPILLEGRRIHEEEAEKILAKFGPTKQIKVTSVFDAMLLSYSNIRSALRVKKTLANSKEHVLAMTILPEYAILGVPDSIDCTDGKHPIIIETKTRDKIPTDPYQDHELQVAIYMMGLERLGFKLSYGVVEYMIRDIPWERKRYRVTLDDSLRKRAVSTAKTVVNLLSDNEEPVATRNPNKCRPCRFRESCKWRPDPG